MVEIWKSIPGYEGAYEVSSLGRVRNLERYVSGGGAKRYLIPQREIWQSPAGKRRYRQVRLSLNGKPKTHEVHRLMALAFFGPPPVDNAEVRHIDGNRENQVIKNLAWGTAKDNCNDRIKHGVQFVPTQGFI